MITINVVDEQELEKIITFNPQLHELSSEKVRIKILQKEIIGAYENDELVGVIGVEYIWTTRPYIDMLYVHEEKRRQKIGQQLLEFLENNLVSQRYKYLYSSAEESAEVSKKWHEKMGFSECGNIDALNLPDKTKEVFYYKELKISST